MSLLFVSECSFENTSHFEVNLVLQRTASSCDCPHPNLQDVHPVPHDTAPCPDVPLCYHGIQLLRKRSWFRQEALGDIWISNAISLHPRNSECVRVGMKVRVE